MSEGLRAASALFKALGHESRLELMRRLVEAPCTVSELVAQTGLSQPLVSQHLRTLRVAGLVFAERLGKEVTYRPADEHISHVVMDAIAHVGEASAP